MAHCAYLVQSPQSPSYTSMHPVCPRGGLVRVRVGPGSRVGAVAKKTVGETLRVGEHVVASVAMPGIPEGTRGRVNFVEGLSWIRYWVRFDNGVIRGSINRKRLARPDEWVQIQARRAAGLDGHSDDTTSANDKADGDADGAAAAGGGGANGGDKVVNGVTVPAHLLERSKNRREILSAA